jgi:hypothetical protein
LASRTALFHDLARTTERSGLTFLSPFWDEKAEVESAARATKPKTATEVKLRFGCIKGSPGTVQRGFHPFSQRVVHAGEKSQIVYDPFRANEGKAPYFFGEVSLFMEFFQFFLPKDSQGVGPVGLLIPPLSHAIGDPGFL